VKIKEDLHIPEKEELQALIMKSIGREGGISFGGYTQ
jgi:hypothetical protein